MKARYILIENGLFSKIIEEQSLFLKTFEEVFKEPFYGQNDIFLAMDWLKELTASQQSILAKEKSLLNENVT